MILGLAGAGEEVEGEDLHRRFLGLVSRCGVWKVGESPEKMFGVVKGKIIAPVRQKW